MKYTWKPVNNQLFPILIQIFHKETRLIVLILNWKQFFIWNRKLFSVIAIAHVWWAPALTENFCCVIELDTSQNVCAYFFIYFLIILFLWTKLLILG